MINKVGETEIEPPCLVILSRAESNFIIKSLKIHQIEKRSKYDMYLINNTRALNNCGNTEITQHSIDDNVKSIFRRLQQCIGLILRND